MKVLEERNLNERKKKKKKLSLGKVEWKEEGNNLWFGK